MAVIRISKRAVDALQPTEKDEIYWDETLSGFGVKVTKRRKSSDGREVGGAKVYVVQRRVGKGRTADMLRYTIGRHGSPWTPDKAREKAEEVIASARAGINLARQERDALAAQEAAEVAAAASERMAAARAIPAVVRSFVEKHHKATQNRWTPEIERTFAKDILPAWEGRSVESISKADVEALLEGIAERAPGQARKVRGILRTLFRWAMPEYDLPKSPLAGVKVGGKDVVRDRVLSDDELRAVWNAADALGAPFGPCIKLLIITGQRRDEVAGMRWSEVNLEERLWVIPASRYKSNRAHMVPLSDLAIEVIESVPNVEGVDLIFTTTGSTPISGFSKAKRLLDMKSGVGIADDGSDAWVLHDLRRTATTGFAKLGVLPYVADKIIGHGSNVIRGVMAVYNKHEYLPDRVAAMQVWANYIRTIIGSGVQNVVPLRRSAN